MSRFKIAGIASLLFTMACASGATQEASVPSAGELKDTEIRLLKKRLALTQKEEREAAIAKLVYKTQLEVAAIRDFGVKAAVAYKPITPREVMGFVDASIEKEYPGRQLALYTWANELFGVIPEGADMPGLYKELMGEQVGGLYDPDSETLFVSTNFNLESPLGTIVLAHEICHALQDQNHDLQAMGIEDSSDADRQMAALAIAEGDATLLMGEHMVQTGSAMSFLGMLPAILSGSQQQFNAAPQGIQQSLLFPYLRGMEFFQALSGRTPSHPTRRVSALDAAWRSDVFNEPPLTTEQVMHPEKYLRRELPGEVPEPTPGLTAEELGTTMGEYGVWLLLQTRLGLERASVAAAGWDGDHLIVSENSDATRRAIDWIAHWDTEDDAKEFAAAFKECFGGDPDKATLGYEGGESVGEGRFKVGIHGKAVEIAGRFKLKAKE